MLRVDGFGHQRVQVDAHLLPAVLFVLHLNQAKIFLHAFAVRRSGDIPSPTPPVRETHLTQKLRDVFGVRRVKRFGQQVEQSGFEIFLLSLRVFALRKKKEREREARPSVDGGVSARLYLTL